MSDRTHIFVIIIGSQLFIEIHRNNKFYRDDKLERKTFNIYLKHKLTHTIHNGGHELHNGCVHTVYDSRHLSN